MTRKLTGLSRRYVAALRNYLKQGPRANLRPARALGRWATTSGLETLDLARIHERALIALVLPNDSSAARDMMARRAGAFFAEAITPIEKTHRIAREANTHFGHLNQTLRQRSADLIVSNRQLKREIVQRRDAEESLRKSEHHYGQLLKQSHRMQEQLRHLTRQLLLAQEEERKKISRELHDEIAQTLTGINIRLAALKTEAAHNTRGLQNKISSTQRMVEKSVDIVHRFARDLRPTVLDDLGLIPALHSFVKTFSKQTRLHISLTVFAGVEKLDNASRTVLYRVAQEALTNVARHAQANRVDVNIVKLPDSICMKIRDDGKSFRVDHVLHTKKNRRLGLLGMRERVEMVGGSFHVESAVGEGTTVQARIPFTNGKRN
jgi:signal transduction histidine kinase